jgi:hypothetical protein
MVVHACDEAEEKTNAIRHESRIHHADDHRALQPVSTHPLRETTDARTHYCVFIKFASRIFWRPSRFLRACSAGEPGPSSARRLGVRSAQSQAGYSSSGRATTSGWPLSHASPGSAVFSAHAERGAGALSVRARVCARGAGRTGGGRGAGRDDGRLDGVRAHGQTARGREAGAGEERRRRHEGKRRDEA